MEQCYPPREDLPNSMEIISFYYTPRPRPKVILDFISSHLRLTILGIQIALSSLHKGPWVSLITAKLCPATNTLEDTEKSQNNEGGDGSTLVNLRVVKFLAVAWDCVLYRIRRGVHCEPALHCEYSCSSYPGTKSKLSLNVRQSHLPSLAS